MHRMICAAIMAALMPVAASAECSRQTLHAYADALTTAEKQENEEPATAGVAFQDYYRKLSYCVSTKRGAAESWMIGYLRERAAVGFAFTEARQGHLSEARDILRLARERIHALEAQAPTRAIRRPFDELDIAAQRVDREVHDAQARASIK